MIDLTNYKILKYNYNLSSDEIEDAVWGKMTESEVKWAVQITLEGINDTSPLDAENAWDLFLLNDKLRKQIEKTLDKYKVKYTSVDLTHTLLDKPEEHLTDYFLERLDEFLFENLDVDGILDRIIDVGVGNITPFEKYFLNNDINPDEKFI